jgi:hypothetical protein
MLAEHFHSPVYGYEKAPLSHLKIFKRGLLEFHLVYVLVDLLTAVLKSLFLFAWFPYRLIDKRVVAEAEDLV